MFIYFFICIYKENKLGRGGVTASSISTYIKAVALSNEEGKNLKIGVIGAYIQLVPFFQESQNRSLHMYSS